MPYRRQAAAHSSGKEEHATTVQLPVWYRGDALKVAFALSFALLMSHPFVAAQDQDPFSIRVESNLVVVQVEVFDSKTIYSWPIGEQQCEAAQQRVFEQLRPSEPFLLKDCYETLLRGLEAKDFHVFEDGTEQNIESLSFEPLSWSPSRDNFGWHEEWSSTPRGKWSTTDLLGWGVGGGGLHLYRLAYVPPGSRSSKCHDIKVTVDRPNATVFARDGYCSNENPVATDPLAGSEFGKQMEKSVGTPASPDARLSMGVSFFFTDVNQARADIVLGIPWKRLRLHRDGRVVKATIGLLGLIYKSDHSVIARFSDFACCSSATAKPAPLEVYRPAVVPARYETQVELPAGGVYDLEIVLSDGKNFWRAAETLNVDGWDGTQLAISSVVLAKRARYAEAAAEEARAVKLAPQYVPLVSKGVQVTPAADPRFKREEHVLYYFEVYKPFLSERQPSQVRAEMRIVDESTGELKEALPPVDAASFERSGSRTIPISGVLPVGRLPKGKYRLEVRATDSAGSSTLWRAASLTLE